MQMPSLKRSFEQIQSFRQPGNSPKSARTTVSSQPLDMIMAQSSAIHPANASLGASYNPGMHFHAFANGLGNGNGNGDHNAQHLNMQLQQSTMYPQYQNEAPIVDAVEPGESKLLNDHVPFITGRPFTNRQQHLAVHQNLDPTDSADFLTADQFLGITDDYVQGLSEKKRDKALLPASRCRNIRAALKDPKATTVESAQFRFWARKMFRCKIVAPYQSGEQYDLVTHESKPVACREDIYQILVDCHRLCAHGGRDKTAAQVRKLWSWIPKDLIARFVAACPKCAERRSSKTPASSRKDNSPDARTLNSSPIGHGNTLQSDNAVFNTPASMAQDVSQFVPNNFSFGSAVFVPSTYPGMEQGQYLGNSPFGQTNPYAQYS